MDESLRESMDYMALKGEEKDKAAAENEVTSSSGKSPTIDPELHDPKKMRDAGYPLVNPDVQPNFNTREGKKLFANGDPTSDQTIGRITTPPSATEMLPSTAAYIRDTDVMYKSLMQGETTEDAEIGLQEAMFQYNSYKGYAGNEAEANRIGWNTADRLERVGFSYLSRSEHDDEGIDDTGLMGLTYAMGSMIMKGAKTPAEAIRNIGATGASEEQLNAAWESASRAAHRNAAGEVDPIATTNEQAQQDPRYWGATKTMLRMDGISEEEIEAMTSEQLVSEGKMYADMAKNNFAAMAVLIGKAATNDELPIGDAISYLLEVDDAMPLEAADFGRAILGLATDPSSYLGVGLFARGIAGLAGKKTTSAILKKYGLISAGSGAIGAGYGGLYDLGMQTIEKQGGRREGYDVGQMGRTAAMGGSIGMVLAPVLGSVPGALKATVGWVDKFKKKNAATMSASDEFKDVPTPDNVDKSFSDRLGKKQNDDIEKTLLRGEEETTAYFMKLHKRAQKEVPADLADWIEDLLEHEPGTSSSDMVELMFDTIDTLLKESESHGMSHLDKLKLEQMSIILEKEYDDIADLITKQRMTVIQGGAVKADPNHAAPLDIVEKSPDERAAFRLIDKLDEYTARLDAKDEFADVAKPDLKVINNPLIEQLDVLTKHDPNVSRNLIRMQQGQDLILPDTSNPSYMESVAKYAKLAERSSDIKAIYRQANKERPGPPFDYATSVNKREGLTTPERNMLKEIFGSKEDLLDLLEVAPSADFSTGQLLIRKEDMFALEQYIDDVVRLHDGPLTDLPLSWRRGDFVNKRLLAFKEDFE